MKKLAILLLNLILISPVFAGNITQQKIPVYSDRDLEKYKKISEPDLSQKNVNQNRSEEIEKESSEGRADQGSAGVETKNEISDSEKKRIEREFNTIAASMISQLKAGNIEGALAAYSGANRTPIPAEAEP